MPDRIAEVILLAEDQMHTRFLRAWLYVRLRISPRQIRDALPEKGRGSGEQFVRERFPVESNLHRQALARRRSLLIVITDLDTREFQSVSPTFSPKEPSTYLFLPKRNIETWIHWLNDQPAEEQPDYKRLYQNDAREAIRLAIDKFDRFVCLQLPIEAATLPSLAHGIKEAQRLYQQERGQ